MRYYDRFGTQILVDMYIQNAMDGSIEKVVEHDDDYCIVCRNYESQQSLQSLRNFALEYCPEELLYLDNFQIVKTN